MMNFLKQYSLKNLILYFIIFILIILIIIGILKPNKQYTVEGFKETESEYLDKLSESDVIVQSFISKRNYSSIGISVATYNTSLKKGYLYVTVIDEKNNQKRFKIKANTIVDNEYVYLKYNLKRNKKYKLKIQIKGIKKPITFLTTKENIEGAELYINDNKSMNNIILGFMFDKNSYYNIWYYIFIIVCIFTYLTLMDDKGGKVYEK